jgi:hypothetical protein
MSAADRLAALQQSAQNRLGAAQSAVTDVQGEVDNLAGLSSDMTAEAAVLGDEKYKAGFADGLAAGGKTPDDGLFSQAEVDAQVQTAVGPLNDQIASLQTQVSQSSQQIASLQLQITALQNQVAGAADSTAAAVLSAVQSTKLDISAKIKATEIDNNALADQLAVEGTVVVPAPVEPGTDSAPASFKKKK